MRPEVSSFNRAKSWAGLWGARVMVGCPASLPSAPRVIWYDGCAEARAGPAPPGALNERNASSAEQAAWSATATALTSTPVGGRLSPAPLAAEITESCTVAGEPAAPDSFTVWPFCTGPTTSSQLQDSAAISSLMAWPAVAAGAATGTVGPEATAVLVGLVTIFGGDLCWISR